MRNARAILEQAARLVRRKPIASIAGSVGLVAVVGVAAFNLESADDRADVAAETVMERRVRPAAEPPVEQPQTDVVAERRPTSTPTGFELPKTADAKLLVESPKTETAVEKPKPAAPIQLASLGGEPTSDEFPKSVAIQLPMPKPPLSPAQRLELQGKDYDKAEKCLAQAIYFEARNEPARGQQAVAQVVLNRVFSPHYPKDVCSVVYQNAHRHLSCQFTFTCDGKPERVTERGAWARANRIAVQALNARVWLPDVNKATHYHAAYVRPHWIRDMKLLVRYGLHIFYRPSKWGDGSNEVHWGTASNSVKPTIAAKPAIAAKRGGAVRAAKRIARAS
jgi:spore germination cell wall hydrolase CwlJ-like protein